MRGVLQDVARLARPPLQLVYSPRSATGSRRPNTRPPLGGHTAVVPGSVKPEMLEVFLRKACRPIRPMPSFLDSKIGAWIQTVWRTHA